MLNCHRVASCLTEPMSRSSGVFVEVSILTSWHPSATLLTQDTKEVIVLHVSKVAFLSGDRVRFTLKLKSEDWWKEVERFRVDCIAK